MNSQPQHPHWDTQEPMNNNHPNPQWADQRPMGNTNSSPGFQNQPNKSPAPKQESNNRAEFGRQIAIFSGNASIKFYEKMDKEGNPTINIEAANKKGAGYDWSNGAKTTFQFMQHELGRLVAVLYGTTPEEKFDNHGIGDSLKSLSIKEQKDKRNFYISISEKGGQMKGAAFDYPNALMIASMALNQFKRTTGCKTNEEALAMIKHFIIRKHYGIQARPQAPQEQ